MAERLQDLPKRAARLCLDVERFAAGELGCDFPPLRCLVAASGGADSTALLRIAHILCARRGGSVAAAHLDHGLRPESSEDAAFVAGLCASLDVPCHVERQDVAALAGTSGTGVEEAGRAARYAYLERIRRQIDADIILVAHQLNDLAEDQLMRLVRGAGWPALGGMTGYDPQRRLLRPLLLTPRKALEDFLKTSGQSWRTDDTNQDLRATRNRVRHQILPGLAAHNPCYLDAAARLWRQARLDGAHWDAELERLAKNVRDEGAGLLIPAQVADDCPAPLLPRLLKRALDGLGPGQALGNGLLRVGELWRAGSRNRRVRFPGDKEALLVRAGIRVQRIDRKKECG